MNRSSCIRCDGIYPDHDPDCPIGNPNPYSDIRAEERTTILKFLRRKIFGPVGWLCKDNGAEEQEDIEEALEAVEKGEHRK